MPDSECPALSTSGGLCPIHQHAALAFQVNFAVGAKCETCQRVIVREDWVDSAADDRSGRRHHAASLSSRWLPRRRAMFKTQKKQIAELPFDAVEEASPQPAIRPPPGPTRFEIPASRATWRDKNGVVWERVLGAHSVDLAWPWWSPMDLLAGGAVKTEEADVVMRA